MASYKELYEELQDAISSAISILEQAQNKTKDTYVVERKEPLILRQEEEHK